MKWSQIGVCVACSLLTGWMSSAYTRSVVDAHLLRAESVAQIGETHLIQARNVSAMLVANLEYQRILKKSLTDLRSTILAAMSPELRRAVEQEERLTTLEGDLQQILNAVQRLP